MPFPCISPSFLCIIRIPSPSFLVNIFCKVFLSKHQNQKSVKEHWLDKGPRALDHDIPHRHRFRVGEGIPRRHARARDERSGAKRAKHARKYRRSLRPPTRSPLPRWVSSEQKCVRPTSQSPMIGLWFNHTLSISRPPAPAFLLHDLSEYMDAPSRKEGVG